MAYTARIHGQFKCYSDNNTQYFNIRDTAELLRLELLKPRLVIRYDEVLIRCVSPESVRHRLAYAMMTKLDMMELMGSFGQIVTSRQIVKARRDLPLHLIRYL